VSRLNNSSCVPLLCYVTDRNSLPATETREAQETLLLKIEAAAAAGVDWIQIREKDLSGREYTLLTREALRRATKWQASKSAATRILVNDRLDVALAERASGVHLAENGLPLPEAKRLANAQTPGQDFLVGVPVTLSKLRDLPRTAARVIFFLAPSSLRHRKRRSGRHRGLSGSARSAARSPSPCLPSERSRGENAADCVAAGAAGIAAIRLFQDASDMSSLIQSLRKLTR